MRRRRWSATVSRVRTERAVWKGLAALPAYVPRASPVRNVTDFDDAQSLHHKPIRVPLYESESESKMNFFFDI